MPENALRQIDPLQPSEETKCTIYNVGDDLYSDTISLWNALAVFAQDI